MKNPYQYSSKMFEYLKENKEQLILEKKSGIKQADSVSYAVHSLNEKGEVFKSTADNSSNLLSQDVIRVRSVINTTNLLDSHGDVHIKGLWKNSLKNSKEFYLLQEHKADFAHVVSDNVKAYTSTITWEELGYNFEGETQALIFESQVHKDRNPLMFEQYARGYVKNHSVGMRYEELILCINSEERYYRDEKEAWDKYIEKVANREEAEKKGYFWAVTQAEIKEGSAVLFGSNWATPTMAVEAPKNEQSSANQSKGMFAKFINITTK